LIFAGSTRLTPNNDFAADTPFENIEYASGAGAFVVGGAAITLNGDIIKSDNSHQEFNCNVTIPSGNHDLQNTENSTLHLEGVWSGAGSITKTGNNEVQFKGDGTNNPFTGSITVSAGLLWFDYAPVNNISGVTIGSGTTFKIGRLTISANITNNGGTIHMENGFGATISGNISNTAALIIIVEYVIQTISGDISGAGAIEIQSLASGKLSLTGTNTHTGAMTITDANVICGADDCLSASSAMILANDAGALLNVNSFDCSIGSLSGGGASGGNVHLGGDGGNNYLTIGNDNTDKTYDGVIDDNGSEPTPYEAGIAKIGTGKQIFTGVNTYWLATSVSGAGSLIINGSQYQNDEFTINNLATIGGDGEIQGDLNILSGGILSPGDDDAATLQVATAGGHDLILVAGSILNFGLGATSDKVIVGPVGSSGLTLAGTINISDAGGFAPGIYEIITYPTGKLTDNTLNIGTVPAGYEAVVDVSEDTKVKIKITGGPGGLVNSGLVNAGLVNSGLVN